MGRKAFAAVARTGSKSVKDKKNEQRFLNLSLSQSINAWRKGKALIAEGKALVADAEADILPQAERARSKVCRSSGEFLSNVVVNNEIMVIWKNQYSKIDPKFERDLKEDFGEKAPQYFEEALEISLKAEAITNEKLLDKLIKACGGKDKLGEYFDVVRFFKPTEKLHQEAVTNKKVGSKVGRLKVRGILKPYKPSLRDRPKKKGA